MAISSIYRTTSGLTPVGGDEDTGSSVNGTIDGSGTTTVANKSGDLGKDAFMKLFVAQIKNQDPLNPADSTESIAQMAQFSSLEQMQNLNATINKLYSYQTASSLVNNAVMIGKTVVAQSSDGTSITGVVKAVGMSDDGTTPLYSVLTEDNKLETVESKDILAISQS